MRRRLTAEEAALWQRVAASVRPLPGRKPPPLPPVLPPLPTAPAPTTAANQPPPRPLRARPPVATAATLDGSWDRKLRQGDIRPDRVIDLHDHSLAAAHGLLASTIEAAVAAGDRIILVITGKGSPGRPGRIRAELGHWLDAGDQRRHVAALRPAHLRHGGGGAFYLILRRR